MSEPKKYRPSNGTEGMWFISEFCEHCRRENPGDVETRKCKILTKTMLYDVNEKDYPKEWTYDEKGDPTCTKYEYHDWNKGYPKPKSKKGKRKIVIKTQLTLL